MNPLSTETGLLISSAVPVAVVGWAILFSVEAARRGPAWAFGHLGIVAKVLKPALAIGIAAFLVVRPMWVGLGIAYPLAVALFMVVIRRRQLAAVNQDIGFGDIRSEWREQVLSRLRRGLIVVGSLALVAGALLASIGVVQGWVVGALAPIAGLALVRSKTGQVGSVRPPSL
ncbi:MAG TPA: hypothetical protein VJQ79_07130 [Acidimicrobiia bacterium]|nr:hypothetical protein [Acidimicrobiia bacterium]